MRKGVEVANADRQLAQRPRVAEVERLDRHRLDGLTRRGGRDHADTDVAFDEPAHRVEASQLHAQAQRPPGAWAVQTRTGYSYAKLAENEVQYIVDFEGPSLKALPAGAEVKAQLSTNSYGQITEANAYPNPATGGWRMTVRAKQVRPGQPLELRGFLQHDNNVLTETWSLVLPPQ